MKNQPDTRGYFPMFIDLSKKKILVIGAGKIGERRIKALLKFGADIKVVAPDPSSHIRKLAGQGQIFLEEREYHGGEIEDFFMVLAATDKIEVNEEVYRECREKGIIVNVASDQTKCDFFFPGLVKEDSTVIGITDSGKNHKKVKKLVAKMKDILYKEGEN